MAYNPFALRVTGLAVLLTLPAWLGAQGIYTCVDAQGRKQVSDRPIPECLDRVQKELGSSGVVRRQIVPTTHQGAQESASTGRLALETGHDKSLREQRQQRALLDRYSSEAVHADERKRALSSIDQSLSQTQLQLTELITINRDLLAQAAPFKTKSQAVPRTLQMSLKENQQSIALLQGVLDERNLERKRTNERFDEELAVLRKLWAQGGTKP
jgi:hypothetical protein